MPAFAARWQSSLSIWPANLGALVVALAILVPPVVAQHDPTLPNAPAGPPEDMRDTGLRIPSTAEQVDRRNTANANGERGAKTPNQEPSCLLPPLSLMRSPAVSVQQLQRTAQARDRYLRGCVALRKKKNAEAEKLFRRAVRDYSKYGVAWVTLGQLLAAEQRLSEGRDACSRASVADPSYVPAYLCQADIAARERAWDEVLKLSTRALELDPSGNAVAYEYHAAANLNLRNLAAAERSALRAVAADRDHHEPRTHFVLAQVYEAKRDATNEALQLREYLKYSGKGPDAAMVEQYLAALERNTAAMANSEAGGGPDSSETATRVGPPDIDAGVPPVLGDKACPLALVLQGASERTLDLIDNMHRFSASEHVEHVDFDRNGNKRNSSAEMANYVVEIEAGSSGYPSIQEYRAVDGRVQRPLFADLGTAAFALIFHPSHLGNFEFHCEGLTELRGQLAWQVRFVEGTDPDRSFTAMRIGRSLHLTRFKGRAWISTDNHNVLQIETDLVNPIEEIKLMREHQVITYAPVEFPSRHIQLWLPESSSLYIAYRGRRYERIHTFSDFQLFSVDSAQADKQPANKVFPFDAARWTPNSDAQQRILSSAARAQSH
jgi:tetratricopeptide (TPR) repeat protein